LQVRAGAIGNTSSVPSRRRGSRGLLLLSLLLATVGVAAVALQVSASAGDGCGGRRWATAWASAPQDAAGAFADQTLRMMSVASAPGDAVRLTFSNRFGERAVAFDDVHVARRLTGADVEPGSVRRVTFGGRSRVRVAPGEQVVSDPAAFEVAPGDELAISFHVGGRVLLDRHLRSIATHYVTEEGAGRRGADVSGQAFTTETQSTFGLVAVDVRAPASVGTLAAIGDSITEGLGTTPDGGRRWTDLLARRLGGRTAVLNAGIGGNHAARAVAMPRPDGGVDDFGPALVDRLSADVLDGAGVTDVLVLAGINDVLTRLDDDVVGAVTAAYERIVERAHARGIRIVGATLTPASLDGPAEADRRAINRFVRTSGLFDAVADFDRAVADPGDPTRLLPAFDADSIHLNDRGHAALATAIDASRLQGTGCGA
jgi:lysophospholipase L1-like esterase